MAVYLIQSETLDDIANAINAKTGGSSAMTPAEMVTEIESIQMGGGGYSAADWLDTTKPTGTIVSNVTFPNSLNNNTLDYALLAKRTGIESVTLTDALVVPPYFLSGCSGLKRFYAPKANEVFTMAFRNCVSLEYAVIPNGSAKYSSTFYLCGALKAVDIGGDIDGSYTFRYCGQLRTVVIRNTNSIIAASINTFKGTPFASGGSGGTIYIPKALYDHLGDGTSLDYKAATNWSTFDGYGTITWAQIEGSIYETQYVDGTPIPTE